MRGGCDRKGIREDLVANYQGVILAAGIDQSDTINVISTVDQPESQSTKFCQLTMITARFDSDKIFRFQR